ncbi:MAG: hypothetical protein NXY59_07525 [Aigarchaeota archaeon]|nr:hypothetical protein [Candidatus Pelearchaeum maunauluense]
MLEAEDVGSYPVAPYGVKADQTIPKMKFQYGKRSLVWADDIEYYVASLRHERWSLEPIVGGIGGSVSDVGGEGIVQLITMLTEHESFFIQGITQHIPRISCYYTEPRIALAYIARDDAKHLDGLLSCVRGRDLGRISASSQFSLKNILELTDVSEFLFIAGLMGKATVATVARHLAGRLNTNTLGALLTHIAEDEERHASFAAAHLRHRIKMGDMNIDTLENLVERFELYLIVSSGMDEASQGEFTALLGREGVREMLLSIDKSRKALLLEAGLSVTDVERLMGRAGFEKSGFC